MSSAQEAFASYRSAEIQTLTQRDLIVKLYQGAERFLIQARAGIDNHQMEMRTTGCQKARRIFEELASTLNFQAGGEIATRLQELYLFFIQEISSASLLNESKRISAILPIIATLREAWEKIPAEHAQTTSLPEGHQGHSLSMRI